MSPGTWPGGAWVPGGPRPCFLLLLLVHDPNFVFRNFHQDVSRFTVHKGLRPNSRIMYRFFTSHQPMMNEQDQVTWTNWPASKKRPNNPTCKVLRRSAQYCGETLHVLGLEGGFGTHFLEPQQHVLRFFGHLIFACAVHRWSMVATLAGAVV